LSPKKILGLGISPISVHCINFLGKIEKKLGPNMLDPGSYKLGANVLTTMVLDPCFRLALGHKLRSAKEDEQKRD